MSKIFISYAHEDLEAAKRLYLNLKNLGADPWLDKEDLLPGEDWERRIVRVIRESSYVVILISRNSVTKRGFFQKEVRRALEVLQEIPPDHIFIIPCRLDESRPAHDGLAKLHWVDLFPSFEDGLKRVCRGLGLEASGSEVGKSVSSRRRRRPIGPVEMPTEVRDLIRKKAEADFPDDFSTCRYQIQTEVTAWRKFQTFQPRGVPDEVLAVILDKAEAEFPDDFSTRIYQAESEVEAWRKLQQLEVPGMPAEDLKTIVERATADFPDDFSTRLYQINEEIVAWRDLYEEA